MGQVKQTVSLITHSPNPQEVVSLAARLCYSNDSIDDLSVKSAKNADEFITKLMEMGHMSPLEHVSFTFGIEGVSRTLLAQITRHRIASFSVKSQRYVSVKDMNYIVPPSITNLGQEAVGEYTAQMQTMFSWYKKWQTLLGGEKETSNEDARFVLPNACESKLIMTMNARELLLFFRLRCCNRAQWEIRQLAWQMLKLCYEVAPAIFSSGGAGCINGKCTEGKKTCGKMVEVKKYFNDFILGDI